MTPTNSATPLSLAIVGHTNTGKTSLIRTLLRSEQFGNVKNEAGTTRHVEAACLMADQTAIIELFDTPGLEDSIALLQTLHGIDTQKTPNDRDRLEVLLHHEENYPEFNQEIKVIRQAIKSDVLLYVIDVREPVLGKYHDEIAILSMAARPIIPIFNFTTNAHDSLEHWREAMAQFNLHAVVAFDTVAFDFEAEKRLYQKLQSVVEVRYDSLQRLIDFRRQRWLSLQQAAAQQVAQLLINIASYRHAFAKEDNTNAIVSDIQNTVRTAEQQCLQNVLAIFQFSNEDLQHHPLPVSNGSWNADLFAPETLKTFGLDAGSAAAKGALVGAGIDLMVAGLSLGTASMVGALLGAGWSATKRYGNDLLAKVKGVQWYCVDEQTATLVLLRQLQLLSALQHRGHAAQDKILIEDQAVVDVPDDWAQRLKIMRNHPEWALQGQSPDLDDRYRGKFVVELCEWVLSVVETRK